jgi:hypothetical protein
MEKADEAKLLRQRYEQEIFRRPQPKVTTQTSTTKPSSTSPATTRSSDGLILDIQLQRAVDTLIAVTILQESPGTGQKMPVPAKAMTVTSAPVVQPTSNPTTAPATAPVTVPTTPLPDNAPIPTPGRPATAPASTQSEPTAPPASKPSAVPATQP